MDAVLLVLHVLGALVMRPLAAKLLLRLDSSAKSGRFYPICSVWARVNLACNHFHFRLSYFHVAC